MIKLIFNFVIVSCWLIYTTEANQCTIAQICVTDLVEADCAAGFSYVPYSSVFGCCPSCQSNFGGGGAGGGGDGGETETPIGECRPPDSCLPDGSYGPVQCKGDLFTGRCFCSDANGNRIFGQMWRDQASEMTCACSRRRADLEASGRKDVTLHCTASGDYEPLQCDDGICWCAQPKTGQPTVPPLPEENMKSLPCYSAAAVGEQYLRRCESSVYALAVIYREQSEHGTNFLGNPITFCDYDGSYGPYQIQNGIAYCTGRDGKILGSWQTMSSEMAGMNCNCARDSVMYYPERGLMVTEVCEANGNYRPNQNIGDVYYCVDTDGFPIEMLDKWPTDFCASYA